MSKPLPYGGFEWIEDEIVNVVADDETSYILECDFHYDASLHDAHSDFRSLPKSSFPPNSKLKKLLGTFRHKNNYILHYENLKQAFRYGLKLNGVHRILKFKQKRWLEPYIRLNTELRMNAKNDFERNLYNLMNNVVSLKLSKLIKITNY